jgi:hypothetical protein
MFTHALTKEVKVGPLALARLCTPARMRAYQRGQGRAFGPFPLCRTSPGRFPLLTVPPWPSPWKFASCMRRHGREAPSLSPFSAHLPTDFRTRPHARVPGRGNPVCHRHWCQPELRLGQEGPEPLARGLFNVFAPCWFRLLHAWSAQAGIPALSPVTIRTTPP